MYDMLMLIHIVSVFVWKETTGDVWHGWCLFILFQYLFGRRQQGMYGMLMLIHIVSVFVWKETTGDVWHVDANSYCFSICLEGDNRGCMTCWCLFILFQYLFGRRQQGMYDMLMLIHIVSVFVWKETTGDVWHVDAYWYCFSICLEGDNRGCMACWCLFILFQYLFGRRQQGMYDMLMLIHIVSVFVWKETTGDVWHVDAYSYCFSICLEGDNRGCMTCWCLFILFQYLFGRRQQGMYDMLMLIHIVSVFVWKETTGDVWHVDAYSYCFSICLEGDNRGCMTCWCLFILFQYLFGRRQQGMYDMLMLIHIVSVFVWKETTGDVWHVDAYSYCFSICLEGDNRGCMTCWCLFILFQYLFGRRQQGMYDMLMLIHIVSVFVWKETTGDVWHVDAYSYCFSICLEGDNRGCMTCWCLFILFQYLFGRRQQGMYDMLMLIHIVSVFVWKETTGDVWHVDAYSYCFSICLEGDNRGCMTCWCLFILFQYLFGRRQQGMYDMLMLIHIVSVFVWKETTGDVWHVDAYSYCFSICLEGDNRGCMTCWCLFILFQYLFGRRQQGMYDMLMLIHIVSVFVWKETTGDVWACWCLFILFQYLFGRR